MPSPETRVEELFQEFSHDGKTLHMGGEWLKKFKVAITTLSASEYERGLKNGLDPVRVGMLRQWINEDRIINNSRQTLITNEDIVFWLTPDKE